jgi:hypothetical protein
MYNKLIIFFMRKKFGLKKYEHFQFIGQKSKANTYYFTDEELIKVDLETDSIKPSNVKLNWLLSDSCQIESKGLILNIVD